MIRRAFTSASRVAFNGLYGLLRKNERELEAVFLSRQIDEPSYDFEQVALEFRRRGWKTTMHLKKVTPRHMLAYAVHVLKELKLLGRCKVAILDRYDPVISLLDFECDTAGGNAAVGASQLPCNTEFPVKPIVLQLWHAFGAFKMFGFQSVDTPEGHSADFTDTFKIHRNYSWVVCSGAGARKAFAEAFSCPEERVVALDRPEYDELAKLRQERESRILEEALGSAKRRFRVLMAPTLRINKESAHPFRDLYAHKDRVEAAIDADVVWSFHPLESGLPAPGNVSQQLLEADLVVTDYSSIVYEAFLLGIPTVFFVPDLESYRRSPGLNTDPGIEAPSICAYDEEELCRLVSDLARGRTAYPYDEFMDFAGPAFAIDQDRSTGTAASRLVDFLIAQSGQ